MTNNDRLRLGLTGLALLVVGGAGYYGVMNSKTQEEQQQPTPAYTTSEVNVYEVQLRNGESVSGIVGHEDMNVGSNNLLEMRINLYAVPDQNMRGFLSTKDAYEIDGVSYGAISNPRADRPILVPDVNGDGKILGREAGNPVGTMEYKHFNLRE